MPIKVRVKNGLKTPGPFFLRYDGQSGVWKVCRARLLMGPVTFTISSPERHPGNLAQPLHFANVTQGVGFVNAVKPRSGRRLRLRGAYPLDL